MQVAIYGAGAIGCYLGALLHQQGLQVTLIGRERMQHAIKQQGGIIVSDFRGRQQQIDAVHFSQRESALANADVVLVTLKCLAMEEAARIINQHCHPGAQIVCLQNGLGSEQAVRNLNPQLNVLRGIVNFNIVQRGPAHFHRASDGGIYIEASNRLLDIQQALEHHDIDCWLLSAIDNVIWAKLQLNLNNAINAIADLPLQQQLQQRGYRRILSAAMKELAEVANSRGIHLARLMPIPAWLLPAFIRAPDFIFTRLARQMLAIDPHARSSMADDIRHQRLTEVQYINGAVANAGQQQGIATPVNHALCLLIHELESGQRRGGLTPQQIEQRIEQCRVPQPAS